MLLFVYGTLKRGFSNYHEMEKLEGTFISEAQTVREFPLVVATECGIPALLNLPGHFKGSRVTGWPRQPA
ncbi:Oidioi.mRNA.OKI2018_I69.chr1.g3764.t1.cds [Oikopleura dioica]|uniref:Gamma-glutamylcyclotransferase family protein n=1 Tax=Oikopleura dioica TaxID=34765 RepID=A0ABN7SZG0_OIKDI|nr:Oidioi.mRNA.OKI2018_I69.chr1.g3764.t1.cds [Oikopleura dioica]